MEKGMTKRQSAILQGVAIWMMVYHHLYCGVTPYKSTFPFLQAEIVRQSAWFCKICVGIFAFISGYALYYAAKKLPCERFWERMPAEYRDVLPRILKLYAKVWLVLIIYSGYLFGTGRGTFEWKEFWGNFTALNPTYNSTWWYVEQYASMLLLFPLLDMLLTRFDKPEEIKKKRLFYGALLLACLGAGAACLFWRPMLSEWIEAIVNGLRVSFLAVFAVGYLTARYSVYQRADALLQGAGVPAKLGLSAVLVGGVIALRVQLATFPAYARTDFVLTPFFIYGLLTLLSRASLLETFFAWWGRYSAYIWLVHGFVSIWCVPLQIRESLWAYPLTLFVSAVLAVVLKRLESYVFCHMHFA